MPLKKQEYTGTHVMKDSLPYPIYKYADLIGGLIYACRCTEKRPSQAIASSAYPVIWKSDAPSKLPKVSPNASEASECFRMDDRPPNSLIANDQPKTKRYGI